MDRRTRGFWTVLLCAAAAAGRGADVTLEAPAAVPRWDVAELRISVADPPPGNPFTEAELTAEVSTEGKAPLRLRGFADAPDGSLFLVRFSPDVAGQAWRYSIALRWGEVRKDLRGELRCEPSDRQGPVVVDPDRPKRFLRAGSRRPFYHLGYTAYHLLDPSNDLATIDRTIAWCAEHGFNKVRFLLSGYPRDDDRRTSTDPEHGVPDPWKRPNYGSKPGQVNALPAWEGEPHRYDFARFRIEHWRRVDHAVRAMRDRDIVATCIFVIEKQDLPRELGRLSEDELRLYRYGVARLAAFDNVWWDLGNEHNETRDVAWGDEVGRIVKEADPYDRLASAHGYAEFLYPRSTWADFIVTQQYGEPKEVHDWVLEYAAVPKPYVNEEYGYEGELEKAGHGQDADRTRRAHWAIAMAGGYATYGDWSGGTSWFYMGEPGPGKAARQLHHLRDLFEGLPFRDMEPRDDLASEGFCLARPPDHILVWLPEGGASTVRLEGPPGTRFSGRWIDPRTGAKGDAFPLASGAVRVEAPGAEDWALHVTAIR